MEGARLPVKRSINGPRWVRRRVSAAPLGKLPAAGGARRVRLSSWDPEPRHHPRGASAWGVEDLVGNGWEWTSTVFAPFPGFSSMPSYPEYSADFFDGQHFVMKGASPATARELIRPTFRNWFRAHYPYVYAAFRCVKSA
jgi:formylglycine-generating enzyme required for sulfatase activity